MNAAPFVVGITATYRRPAELAALVASLAKAGPAFGALLVVDNANDPAIATALQAAPVPTQYTTPGENLGCAGGLRFGEQQALATFGERLTHVWYLDDDCVVSPGTLTELLRTMAATGAQATHPLTLDAAGRLGWFPGLLNRRKLFAAKAGPTAAEYLAQCGAEPEPFSWSPGVALLVTAQALQETGGHDASFWIRGEDLEFSLHITHRHLGLFVPTATVRHLPPPGVAEAAQEYAKHCAMLQNLAYIAVRLPHGRRLLRTLPGNWLRFLRTWPAHPRTWRDAARAFWQGAALGHPAGRTGAFSSS